MLVQMVEPFGSVLYCPLKYLTQKGQGQLSIILTKFFFKSQNEFRFSLIQWTICFLLVYVHHNFTSMNSYFIQNLGKKEIYFTLDFMENQQALGAVYKKLPL